MPVFEDLARKSLGTRLSKVVSANRVTKFFAICCICAFAGGVAASLNSGAQPEQQLAKFSGAAVTPQKPGELKGRVIATPTPNANRCVPDPVAQINSLRDHGDILGFRMGAGYPDPDGDDYHWQGIQRLPISGGRVFAVSSSAPRDKGGHLAIVQFGSRRPVNGRLRSNRLSVTTQDWNVPPLLNDIIVQDVLVDPVFDHPGGLQTLGRYLFVSLELIDSSDRARVYLYDSVGTQDPWSCNQATGAGCLRKVWEFVVAETGAGTVSAAQLADGRYLMITTPKRITKFEVHVSQRGKALTDSTLFGSGGSYEALWDSNGHEWTDYQNLNLLTGCNGQLYLLGSHKNDGGWFGSNEDWIDLFELHLVPDGGTNADGDATLSVSLNKVAKRHVYCGTSGSKRQCDLDAAGGVSVDARGRLFFYATEHDNDGKSNSVKMMEFRPADHLDDPSTSGVEGCPTLTQAYVELFDEANDKGNSLMIDYVDRSKRNYNRFDTAFSFNDRTRSARQCIPVGYRYRLWNDFNRSGQSFDLVGSGAREYHEWSSRMGFSSGCFHDGVRCL